MVPRIPCELSEPASDNSPTNIKAHSKARALRFATMISPVSNSGKYERQIAYCVYYQPVTLARTFLIEFFTVIAQTLGHHVISLPQLFNVATYFVDRNVLEGRAENIAIESGDERVTYQQLLERTNRAGNALRSLGVRRKERVLLLLLDSPEFLYSFFGTIKIGAVAVPVNTQAKPREYEYMLNDCRARVAVVSESLLSQLQAIPRQNLPYLREITVTSDANRPTQLLRFCDLMNAASPDLAAAPTRKDDAAFWLYSSGSTGVPKGCVHLHHDMVVSSHHYAHIILKINEQDRCFSVARLFFAYGLGNAGYFPLSCGATTILSPARPTPASVYADIERYRPLSFFPCPQIMPLCSIITALAVPTSISLAFVTLFPPAKPCLPHYSTASVGGSISKSSTHSAPQKASTW
jgi:acyl-CoA synthetase (AMP-forming)/AMP-acid ligase II